MIRLIRAIFVAATVSSSALAASLRWPEGPALPRDLTEAFERLIGQFGDGTALNLKGKTDSGEPCRMRLEIGRPGRGKTREPEYFLTNPLPGDLEETSFFGFSDHHPVSISSDRSVLAPLGPDRRSMAPWLRVGGRFGIVSVAWDVEEAGAPRRLVTCYFNKSSAGGGGGGGGFKFSIF